MSFWAVVRAEPGHDRLAVASVTLAGFETFAPKTRIQAGAKWRTVPLFSAYFFARVEDHWRAIERALGVAGLVKFGLTPARCPDEEIAKLIARSDPDGVVRLAARPSSQTGRSGLAPGARVRIVDGPLRGFDGLYAGMARPIASSSCSTSSAPSVRSRSPPRSSPRAKVAGGAAAAIRGHSSK